MKTMMRIMMMVGIGTTIAGCATGPKSVSVDKGAVERSKIYLESIEVAEASDSSAQCAVPAGLENAYSSGKGASAQWKDLLARASKCAAERNWGRVEIIAQTMSRLDIDSPWGPYFMSVAANELGDWSRAHWMLDLAEKKSGSKLALFSYQRGRVHLARKETAKAMMEFQKAVALEPKLVDAAMYLAGIHYRDHEWKEAAEQYAVVLTRKPGNYQALVGMAEAKFHSGNPKEAASFYVKALEVDSKQLQAWLRMGEIYETAKEHELALSAYKELRRGIESGQVKQRPSMDLNAKIKALEAMTTPPERSQASVKEVDEKRSKK